MKLRLGTRKSPLARWQADWVAARLAEFGIDVEMVLISTEGDVRSGPLGEIGGQGLFTKRIQQALLDSQIDLAVHSLKDLPTEPVPGLLLAAVPEREAVGDVLVSPAAAALDELPSGAVIGTGSNRRRAQLLHHRRDLQVRDIRGNVDTRLRKLEEGEYDAIILAEAGLRRLGLSRHITHVLSRDVMLPAVGQGALGIEARQADEATRGALQPLNHPATQAAVLAERALLAGLRAGCLAPVGAWAHMAGEQLTLDAVVLSPDGDQRLLASSAGAPAEAEALGEKVARDLLQRGATELIHAARQ
ncbi:MAG: hydroxymethylbilane synthase [Pirellulaceae bacterium]